MSQPARRTQVLIAGGGPAGAMAASLLAREGVEVTLCERERFPRYHVGESLLVSALPALGFIDLLDEVDAFGFVRKRGGFFKLLRDRPPGFIDFSRSHTHPYSYQVKRSEFDELLLRHAERCGARVHEATTITELRFAAGRPVSASWRDDAGASGVVAFDYLIDATGLSGLLATGYLHNRRHQSFFANVAMGSYWTGYRDYVDPRGLAHLGDFFMEALPEGEGWTWSIPLHDRTLSVGVVVHRDRARALRAAHGGLEAIYRAVLARSPNVWARLRGARMVTPVRAWKDYSHAATEFAGPGFRIVGDAACFIDPLLSTGVHMAFLGAQAAAASICAELRDELEAGRAERFHDRCVRAAYARFVIAVAGFYLQMKRPDEAVLGELDELGGLDADSFDLAFEQLAPLLSGAADSSAEAAPDRPAPTPALEQVVEFMTQTLLQRFNYEIEGATSRLLARADGLSTDVGTTPAQPIDGLYIRMQRGALGLANVHESDHEAR